MPDEGLVLDRLLDPADSDPSIRWHYAVLRALDYFRAAGLLTGVRRWDEAPGVCT
jgi:hypothetical protein